MEEKKFRFFKIIIVILLAAIVSTFVTLGNYVVPLLALLVCAGVIFILKSKVTDVLADERVAKISGQAARMTYSISSIVLGILTIIFMALSRNDSNYILLAYTMAYLLCGIMMLYLGFYWYYNRRVEG